MRNERPQFAIATIFIALLAPAASAQAAWVKIDDFSFTPTGTDNTAQGIGIEMVGGLTANPAAATPIPNKYVQDPFASDNNWSFLSSGGTNTLFTTVVADPAGGSNKVLRVAGEWDRTMSKAIPSIAPGSTGTLYFKFRVNDFTTNDDGAAGPDAGPSVGIGLSYDQLVNNEVTTNTLAYSPGLGGPWVNLNSNLNGGATMTSPGTNKLSAVTSAGNTAGGGGTQATVNDNTGSEGYATDTWYEMWLVGTNSNASGNPGPSTSSVSFYMRGGAFGPIGGSNETVAPTLINETVQFRYSPTTPSPLTRLWIRANNANSDGTLGTTTQNAVFFDDLFVDATGSHLTTPSAVPGDFDGDRDVDGADFVAWQTNFPKATGALPSEGDADGDGDVDGADFVVWQTHFPTTAGPGASSIPEPYSLLSMAIASILVGTWCRLRIRRANRLALQP